MNNYEVGSIWRKWDLQVQTRLDKGYKCLGINTLTAEQIDRLFTLTGLEKVAITSQEKASPLRIMRSFLSLMSPPIPISAS